MCKNRICNVAFNVLGIRMIFAHLWRDVTATVVRSTWERISIIYWWPMSCSPAFYSCCTIWHTTSASSERCGRQSPTTVCRTLKIEFSVEESEMCHWSDWRTWGQNFYFKLWRSHTSALISDYACLREYKAVFSCPWHVKCSDLQFSPGSFQRERMDLDLSFVLLNEQIVLGGVLIIENLPF